MGFLFSAARWILHNRILSFLILVGLLLRIVGTNPGYFAHGDEVMYGEAVYMLLNKTLSMEVNLMGYPPLIPWTMLLLFILIFIPLMWLWFFASHIYDFLLIIGGAAQSVDAGMVGFARIFHNEILGRNWINAMYWGRYVTAFFGSGAIFLVYKLARTYFDKKSIALIAAFFTAINYRLVLNSRIGFPDTYNVFFFLLALWSIGLLLKKQSIKTYLFAWITSALSFLTKYQVYALVPLFLVHTIVSVRSAKGKPKKFLSLFFAKSVIIGGLVALALVIASHAYHLINIERVIEINSYEALKYGFGRNVLNIFPISYLYHIGAGPFISALFLLGILVGLVKKEHRIETLVLLSPLPIFAYFYLYYTVGGFFTRNFLAAIPLFLLFASIPLGVGLSWFLDKSKNRLQQAFVFFALLTLLFAAGKNHAINSFISSKTYSQPSPLTQAKQYLEENISGEIVFGAYHGHPTPLDPNVEIKQLPTPSKAFGYRELAEEGYDMAVIDFSVVHDLFLWWMTQPSEMGLRFFSKPDDLLSQNYFALATREYLWSYAEKAFLTPWQAPGYNYAIASTKKEERYKDTEAISRYDFNNSGSWQKVTFLKEYKDQLGFEIDQNGDILLSVKPGNALPGAIRWQSEPVEVKPGLGYTVSGLIGSNRQIAKEGRNGFLRLDFYTKSNSAYSQEPKPEINSRPIISFVSKRVYGDTAWHEVYIQGIAPADGQFMVVGFQADSPDQTFFLKDVKIYQTSGPVRDEGEHMTIPDEDFFLPNNNGFL